MPKIFISHASSDDAFVRGLQQALGDLGQDVWVDSRQLRGGDSLWPEIQKAIEEASAFAVLVSPEALQSRWVGKELRHALEVQKRRDKNPFPIIPLSLNDTRLGVLEEFFCDEPMYIPVNSSAGGIDSAIHPILVAIGLRLPADVPAAPQARAEPLEELVLELTDLKIQDQEGTPRASGRARLVYKPAIAGQREVAGAQAWRFVAPLGSIEAEELRWYLEKYAVWPSTYFLNRARKVEENLTQWGQLLYAAALPVAATANVMNAWARISDQVGRRFSVHVDRTLETGASESEIVTAREVATLLLGLPWELLHDGGGFLFQGAKPVRVRRRLPNTRVLDVAAVAAPIRILLVTARPDDDACGYIDHRASALPLVEATEALGGLVYLHVLSPPTLPALREELDRARRIHEPYHVVHFDGHGTYDRKIGLGGLCFEDPQDLAKLENRRHLTVFADQLGPLLRNHRIPLVFLEACQSAKAEKASESVASSLLESGVASVVAMSHSVLVETARRFVQAFYGALARGARVGEAMLEGQRQLKENTFRGRIFGVGEFRLEDWFVPVLFQEEDDPQLFKTAPSKQTQADLQSGLRGRLGELPVEPPTGFIGRSRELLAIQRLLSHERYVVVRGQGGEGKTALASEFARWMVRSQQIRRAAFVSVENYRNPLAVLDVLGRQLVPGYSAATQDMDAAIQTVERALAEQPTLLVVDNLESILHPPFLGIPEALSEEAHRELDAILLLCARLNAQGETRLVFTSREPLPSPFEAARNRRELSQLDREDAVKLVERALDQETSGAGAAAESAGEEIQQLVEAVHGHARTLALLAPSLRERGVEATRQHVVELMAEMERKFPGEREKSVFASVELSLRRLSHENRDKARVLGVFHGGFKLETLGQMMQWGESEVISLAVDLVSKGLATANCYNHLTLNPALCPYLRRRMDAVDLETITARWGEAMLRFVRFLRDQQSQNAELAATLTVLELPNLFALLEHVQCGGGVEATIDLSTSLHILVAQLGKPRLLERVAHVRDVAASALGDSWNHSQFQVQATQIEQFLAAGRGREAMETALQLHRRARLAGQGAYANSEHDFALSCLLLARALRIYGQAEQAFSLLEDAQDRFDSIVKECPRDSVAQRMIYRCLNEKGDCLWALGRLDQAAIAYEEFGRRAEALGDYGQVGTAKAQLGTLRKYQHRYLEALKAHHEAREFFKRQEDPFNVAASWHQTGMTYQMTDQPEEAEAAYLKSLSITVQIGNVVGQANTLSQLGSLYLVLDRPEDAAYFFLQAAEKFEKIPDPAKEGITRTNRAETLRILRRFDEARKEILRAIECKNGLGHAVHPWATWHVLGTLEEDEGQLTSAAESKRKARDCYLTYRREGGENHFQAGSICLVILPLITINPAAAAAQLRQLAADPKAARLIPFIQALVVIAAGSRDKALADAPGLDYTMAAEILFLIETLEKPK